MNQVFINLVQNAIHAVEHREQGEVCITTELIGDEVSICIRDNGCGIAEDKLSDIFNLFFTTKTVGKGAGLGLSLSHGIVEKHRDRIQVDTCVGEFTAAESCCLIRS